jgi:hypothetical protein
MTLLLTKARTAGVKRVSCGGFYEGDERVYIDLRYVTHYMLPDDPEECRLFANDVATLSFSDFADYIGDVVEDLGADE